MAKEDGVRFMGHGGLVFDGRTLFIAFTGLVAALLVWGLMAAPALAKAKAKAGGAQATAGDVHVQYVDCSQVQAAFANQNNGGSAGAATAQIAQYLNINQSQVNGCLGGGNPSRSTSSRPLGKTTTPKGVVSGTESASKLPDTGGMPVPSAILGFAMVAAGILSAGAIVRRSR